MYNDDVALQEKYMINTSIDKDFSNNYIELSEIIGNNKNKTGMLHD